VRTFDANLEQFATEKQWAHYLAYFKHGSERKAADALGCDRAGIGTAIRAIEKKATAAGYAPDQGLYNPFPMGRTLGKVTIQSDATGKVIQTWARMEKGEDEEDRIKSGVEAFLADRPKIEIPPFTFQNPDKDIIPWFQIGDAHLGMVSWMRETGHNFDLDIGAAELGAAFDMLLEQCEPGERCVINDMGDGTHYENFKAETEQSGNRLDADGRFPKMIEVYGALFKALIDRALTKFQHVDVIINQGNHSRTNDIWMAFLIRTLYADSDRVTAVPNEPVFIPYLMGKTFVLVHHSDRASGKKLADVMLSDYRDALKQAEFFYIDTGHIHHRQVAKEYGLIEIESWNNLAPNDKFHHDAGWRSKQSMALVFRSRTYGDVGRRRVPVQMVWDRLSKASGVRTSMPDRKIYTV